ncbi:MAG TPA: lipid-A-disaccharide synthase [Stellaceae bacterium]|nr:lipid-A-disaccharide synthase [Stellaceae bacterium]
MSEEAPLFFLIAGEPSGDVIGANLMRALKARLGGHVRFAGIGGERMAAEGLVSQVPIRELAIMGVLEVLPSARRILRRVRETVDSITALGPRAVVTIDSSGFCFRVGERLKKLPQRPPIIHYVAPMVWAWRPKRAFNAKRACDHLLTLLPFEPPYFERIGLPATYVGHPVVESGLDQGNGTAFRERHAIAAQAPVLCLLPGSRRSEVSRLMPVFAEAVGLLRKRYPDLAVVLPTVANAADLVRRLTAAWAVPPLIIDGTEKADAFAGADVALAASGTVSLELAMARLPMVIAYKIFGPTHYLVKRMVKIPHASLVSILLGRKAIPEFLQHDCAPENLAAAVMLLMADSEARHAQIHDCHQALVMIGLGGEPPGFKAADKILELAGVMPAAL